MNDVQSSVHVVVAVVGKEVMLVLIRKIMTYFLFANAFIYSRLDKMV